MNYAGRFGALITAAAALEPAVAWVRYDVLAAGCPSLLQAQAVSTDATRVPLGHSRPVANLAIHDLELAGQNPSGVHFPRGGEPGGLKRHRREETSRRDAIGCFPRVGTDWPGQ